MPRYTGTWTARIEQDFDVEAETEDAAREMVRKEMDLRHVAEMVDMEIESIEEEVE